MTTLDDHIEYVTENPENRAAALALVDRLLEVPGSTYMKALRTVATIVRVPRRSRELACAANLLADESPVRVLLFVLACRACLVDDMWDVTAVVVEGRGHPRETARTVDDTMEPRETAVTITIPAKWLLDSERVIAKLTDLASARERAFAV